MEFKCDLERYDRVEVPTTKQVLLYSIVARPVVHCKDQAPFRPEVLRGTEIQLIWPAVLLCGLCVLMLFSSTGLLL